MDNIQPIIDRIYHNVETHRIAAGKYARWIWQEGEKDAGSQSADARAIFRDGNRQLGINPYGCADAANILYTINRFPADAAERAEWVAALQDMQDGETGLFFEKTHNPFHTTAHCTAALELFDALPLHPLTKMREYLPEGRLEQLLDSLDWQVNPWRDSHIGAGIYAAMINAGEADPDWCGRYFKWLWDNADPETGFWKKGEAQKPGSCELYRYMAGGFHYMFNHEYARMPLRYPDRVIDSCISMYDEKNLPDSFGTFANFIEVDWIYCLTRASRQTPYRHGEVQDRLRRFWKDYREFWFNADWDNDESLNDLHTMFGGVCALAELQQALRGELVSDKPLRLVLDRRPFI